MQTSEQVNELATALALAQGQIKGAIKERGEPAFQIAVCGPRVGLGRLP
jgi:hypothetical protein